MPFEFDHVFVWFSLGLSMYPVHHEKPQLSWVELKSFVQPASSSETPSARAPPELVLTMEF